MAAPTVLGREAGEFRARAPEREGKAPSTTTLSQKAAEEKDVLPQEAATQGNRTLGAARQEQPQERTTSAEEKCSEQYRPNELLPLWEKRRALGAARKEDPLRGRRRERRLQS